MKVLNEFDNSSFDVLRNEIHETLGKKIKTAGDCLRLSMDISNKISITVNSNTLRRFFGLVKTDYSPSSTTLDILSKYCGFNSFDEFINLKIKKASLYDQNVGIYEESILNHFISLFKNTPVKEYDDPTFYFLVKEIIIFLQRHPELIDKFQKAVAKTNNGQNFYYEQFINMDNLNSFYGKGLKYYLMEKKTTEAQIFGHSLLCLKSWLTADNVGVNKHYDELKKYDLAAECHPFLAGRFFATQLLHAEVNKLPIEEILYEARKIHSSIKHNRPKDKYRFFPSFVYIISPVLLLIQQNENALYYIDYYLNNYQHRHLNLEQGFYQSLDLYAAFILFETGRKKEALSIYRKISPSKFYFLTKKYDTITYHFLSQRLQKNYAEAGEQIEKLISETGFERLKQFIKN